MILSDLLLGTDKKYSAYIAGTADGIVTIAGRAAARDILLLDAKKLVVIERVSSLRNGHYMFMGLDINEQYLVICRDLPPNGVDQRYEPSCWDYVTPATDLTADEQQELWQSWQIE